MTVELTDLDIKLNMTLQGMEHIVTYRAAFLGDIVERLSDSAWLQQL